MNTYNVLSDYELTERFNRNDKSAFTAIYDRYWGILYQHARRMLRDDQQAEDIVQDVFITLLHKEGQLRLRTNLSAYLYSITRNSVINQIRKNQVKVDYLQYLEHSPQSEGYLTDRNLLEKELAQQIENEIEALPPKMREVFEMSRKAHMKTAEIARERNVSQETVKKQLYQAMKILKGKLGTYFFFQIMLAILWINRHFGH